MIRRFSYGSVLETEAILNKPAACSDTFPYFTVSEEDLTFTYIMDPADIIYGLGENVRGINKRGWIYESKCSDEPEHLEDRHSLYGAHNFFVVSGNLGRVEAVRQVLQSLLNRSALLTSAAASQIISNVPAAVLLSAFTENWKELLQGVNIGGLGTPIASLASLITLKLYLKSEAPRAMRFLGIFMAVNLAGLAILLLVALIFA